MQSSILHAEIAEQPTALARLLDAEAAPVRALAQDLGRRRFDYVLIAARGSSDNAARYAQYLFGAALGLPVALATPSLHTLYGAQLRFSGALVIGISQSGQSPDIGSVIAAARAAGAPTVAITNDVASPLARAAEHVIALHAGAERSVAATKTYSAADFQHGPIALVRESFPVLMIATRGAAATDLAALAARLRGLGARLLAISDLPEVLAACDRPAALPASVEERLSPLTAVVAGQRFG